MTTHLNANQFHSVAQEGKKMSPDHEPLSGSTQNVALQISMLDARNASSSQPITARVPTLSEDALRPCFYIALRCSRCGNVRQAISIQPIHDTVACPECALKCHFVVLGSGLTRRNLPFHEVHSAEQTRWDHRIEDHRIEVETNSS
jgi:hypothetical protein